MWRKVSFANKKHSGGSLDKGGTDQHNATSKCWLYIIQDRTTCTGLTEHQHKKELLPENYRQELQQHWLCGSQKKEKREREKYFTRAHFILLNSPLNSLNT